MVRDGCCRTRRTISHQSVFGTSSFMHPRKSSWSSISGCVMTFYKRATMMGASSRPSLRSTLGRRSLTCPKTANRKTLIVLNACWTFGKNVASILPLLSTLCARSSRSRLLLHTNVSRFFRSPQHLQQQQRRQQLQSQLRQSPLSRNRCFALSYEVTMSVGSPACGRPAAARKWGCARRGAGTKGHW